MKYNNNKELEQEFWTLHDKLVNEPESWNEDDRNYWINFTLDSVNKEFNEIKKRYCCDNKDRGGIYGEQKQIFDNRVVIPFADLCVNTVCTLNCKECSVLEPYNSEKVVYSSEEIIKSLEKIFRFCDYIHIISPLGGEPFLNKDIDTLLEYLAGKRNRGQIGYIRIVTNGTIIPSNKVLKAIADNKINILISNYENVFNNSQREKVQQLIEIFNQMNIKYYYMPKENYWISMGGYSGKNNMGTEQLKLNLHKCLFKNCTYIKDGKMYRCARLYAFENIYKANCLGKEFVDFNQIQSKEELKRKLYEFYSCSLMESCSYCNDLRDRINIEPAIQV